MAIDTSPDAFAEVERYELHRGPLYRFDANRRQFVQMLGAGLVVAVAPPSATANQRPGRGRGRGPAREETLAQRLHLGPDGTVTILTSKVEVGQGSRTQLAQAAAEELRIPTGRIALVMADTELCPDDGGTAGSRTTPSTVPRVRAAAAAARELLAQLAAERLSVDRSSLAIQDGQFTDTTSGKQVTLAELAAGDAARARLQQTVFPDVALTPVDQWKVLGTPVAKVNGTQVVTGAAIYPSDVVRPGMLRGKVLRPASFGATLDSVDLAPAQAMPGVTVVRDGNFVGCAAKNSWLASRAIDAIAATARWQSPPHPSSDELFAHLKGHAGQDRGRPRSNDWGDPQAARAQAKTALDASYTVAYIQHAPMEPRAAVAEWTLGKLTVWTSTQQPSRVQSELMEAFRLPADRVRVIAPDSGGGFGGKHTGEAAVEAARLAQAAGQPVSLCWTREEEFNWAYCRPAGLIEVQAGLDQAGKLLVWDFANYNSGGSAIESPYQVPHGSTRFLPTDSPLRQGSYRALASTANTFARESAMDELAVAAGADPLDFRLDHLPPGRLRDVLQAAAKRFDWRARRTQREANRGVGLACGTEKGSYVAACALVQVGESGIRVLEICQAFECGAIQNPANLRAQVEGSIIMGLGGALTEEVRFKDGRVTNASFSQYLVPRMADVPQLDIVLVDRPDLPSVGAGETPIIAVAPAVANAIFHAAGTRTRSMPMALDHPAGSAPAR